MHDRSDDQCSSEKGAPNNANGAPQLEHEVLVFSKNNLAIYLYQLQAL